MRASEKENIPFRDPQSRGAGLLPVGKEAYTLHPAEHLGSATVPSSSKHPKSADPFSVRRKARGTHSGLRDTQKLDPHLRRSCPSLQLHPYPRVLAPRSESARSREQQAAPSSAPHRVRNPCLGFGRDATSVPSGWCLGLGSRALSGYESPGSEWEPLLPPQIRGGKQCDRPELWARPQPPRPPSGRTHLRPASRSLRPIGCSSAG